MSSTINAETYRESATKAIATYHKRRMLVDEMVWNTIIREYEAERCAMLEALVACARTLDQAAEYLAKRKAHEEPRGDWGFMMEGTLQCLLREASTARAAIAKATGAKS